MKPALRFLIFASISVLLSVGCRAPQSKDVTGSLQSSIPTGTVHITASGGSYRIPDPLVSLNKLFLDGYKERQATIKTNVSPLIVANFSTLELYWHGVSETNRCIPDIYHALKAVAHVPFGIFLRVEPFASETNARVPDSVLQALKAYESQIEAAAISLPQAGFSETQLVRQKQILSASMVYTSNAVATAKAPRTQLMAFARSVGPLMLENANDAAVAQLDRTHAAVMAWKRRIPSSEWTRLVVVVRGFQMPRRMHILTQYFAKLLGEPSHGLGYPLESRRLIYAEFIPNNRDYLDLMATTFIDGDTSEAFFGDRWRMSRDVLADGAEAYLRKLNFAVSHAQNIDDGPAIPAYGQKSTRRGGSR